MSEFDYDFEGDDFDDNPYNPGTDLYYEDEEEEETNILELFELCIQPTVRDGFSHVGKLLLWCAIFRLSTQIISVPMYVGHAVSACAGLYILHHFFHSTMMYIIGFAVVLYLVLWFLSELVGCRRGPVVGVISVVFLIVCELFFVDGTSWHKIRGAQMVLAMKVISLSFDTDIGALQKLPSPLAYAGYVFNVGTCIFGPWVPYRDYIAVFNKPIWNLQWLWKICSSLLISLCFLTVSTCWIHWLIPDNAWRWWLAYRDALSFRSSHYFISFASEASAVMAGIGRNADDDWNTSVSKPQFIEIPRSLVQVVVYWNMPMHHWLKNYVFRTTKPLGSFTAVLSTYVVSSLLHGLNFQLAAVLLSLGGYTYVEYVLRQKLASVFKSCILVRSCRKDCSHVNRETRLAVVLANVGFGILVVFHLAYLGVMFDSSSKEQEEGYSYTHTLSKWSSLSYASHWFALCTYIFYLLI